MAKHPELKGRELHQATTNIKKGSGMPSAKKNEKTKTFIVAPNVRMGAPDGSGTVEGGGQVQLTKSQAEWCMANDFIDSILPDFEDSSESAEDSASEESSGDEVEGEGAGSSDSASSKDGAQEKRNRTSGRKKPSL